jgi:hypothetical protein
MFTKANPADFTAEELKTIQTAALRVWDEIAGDCLVDENGQPDESATLPRDQVVELVCDANRLEEALRHKHPELATRINNLYNISDLVTPAFKHKIYGY